MAKRKNGEFLFGIGLLGLTAALAYLRLTPEQKKKLGQLKDEFLGLTDDHVSRATGNMKDVTDSLSQQGQAVSEAASEKFETAKEQSQAYTDDVLKVVEAKFDEFKQLLQKNGKE